jgi:hypothetical protein
MTTRSGAVVVAFWAALNLILTGVLAVYGGPTGTFRLALYGSGAVLVALIALIIVLPARGVRPAPTGEVSGGPAIAFGAACLAGGLAWVFGVYLAYLATPLVVYCFTKLRAERKARA